MNIRRLVTSRMRADSVPTRLAIQAYGRMYGVSVRFEGNVIAFRLGGKEIRISSAKIPYARDMILHFSSYYGAVYPDHNDVVDFSEPRLHRYSKSGVTFFLPSIAEEEDAIESYFRSYTPKPGDLVFDIGAHAGVSTYFLSQAVGSTGKVYAFEPDPQAWTCLIRNIESLGMSNVVPVQKAVAGRSGRMEFQAEGSLGSALVSVASRSSAGKMIEVDAIEFSQACALAGGRPTFIKMDIEGAELEVVASSRHMLRESPMYWAIDSNHTVGGRLTNDRLESLFKEVGYSVFSSAESGFMTTWAWSTALLDRKPAVPGWSRSVSESCSVI